MARWDNFSIRMETVWSRQQTSFYGALEGGNLRPSANRFWSVLFSRLQATILVPVSYMEDFDLAVFSFSCKRINSSIRASPFDSKGLTSPPHWELGFNIRSQ